MKTTNFTSHQLGQYKTNGLAWFSFRDGNGKAVNDKAKRKPVLIKAESPENAVELLLKRLKIKG